MLLFSRAKVACDLNWSLIAEGKHVKKSLLFILAFSPVSAFAHADAKPPKDVIGMDKAKATAEGIFKGKIEGSELEFEKNQWLYSFDIRGKDKKIHEIQINAKTGAVVGNDIESPADERKEAGEDAKGNG
jgi:uncharacterized membrane protein YkoI